MGSIGEKCWSFTQEKAIKYLNKASERKIQKKIKYCILVFYAIAVGIFFVMKILVPEIFYPQSYEQIKDIIAIIYGLVGTFVAVMVPLHYSLSFNILGEIEDALNNLSQRGIPITEDQKKAKMRLKHYCHTAEGLVFSFAIFGALVLLEGAFVVTNILGIIIPIWIKIVGIVFYFVILSRGLGHNLELSKEWELNQPDEKYGPSKYMIIYISSLFLSGIWGSLLLVSSCNNLNAFIALVLVIGYYLLWILLRHLFAPLSNMRSLIISE